MTKRQTDEALGALLGVLRHSAETPLTQDGLARALKCSSSKVALIESGNRPIREADVNSWASALGVDANTLRRVIRGFRGYLSAPDGRELWWQEPWSAAEVRPFEVEGQEFGSEEERELLEERAGEDWHDYVTSRYVKVVQELVLSLLEGRRVDVGIVPGPTREPHALNLVWTGGSRPGDVRLELRPPLETAAQRAQWIHAEHPGSPRALEHLEEILTPHEVDLVTAYALGLVANRARGLPETGGE